MWTVLLLLIGCAPEGETIAPDLRDDPEAYVDDVAYGRGILERDLVSVDNLYAQKRLERYGVEEHWEGLAERDPVTRSLRRQDVERLLAGEEPELDAFEATSFAPEELPDSDEEWIALGRRVFFEYPLRHDPTYTALAGLEDGALEEAGFLRDGDAYVGLAVFEENDRVRVGNTCAQCHATADQDGFSGRLSNRTMDIGAARLRVMGLEPGDLPPELESTSTADLDRLGPGRMDVLSDGEFNPYAIPDFGGLVDMPYLHHNANWHHRGVATLAVRCETLFITSNSERTRIPRVLSWAFAMYVRSLSAPDPLRSIDDGAAFEAGEALFESEGCVDCHAPPLYTSDREVEVEYIGTDPLAGLSRQRETGLYRVPSLRGVGRTAPYLHHGAFGTLEAMFDPDRDEPGHEYGLDLSEADRALLIGFLERI
jgi:mono/diheme cytochrome c family protein